MFEVLISIPMWQIELVAYIAIFAIITILFAVVGWALLGKDGAAFMTIVGVVLSLCIILAASMIVGHPLPFLQVVNITVSV